MEIMNIFDELTYKVEECWSPCHTATQQTTRVVYCKLFFLFDSSYFAKSDSVNSILSFIHKIAFLYFVFPVAAAHFRQCNQQSEINGWGGCHCVLLPKIHFRWTVVIYVCCWLVFCNNEMGKRNILALLKMLSVKWHSQIHSTGF